MHGDTQTLDDMLTWPRRTIQTCNLDTVLPAPRWKEVFASEQNSAWPGNARASAQVVRGLTVMRDETHERLLRNPHFRECRAPCQCRLKAISWKQRRGADGLQKGQARATTNRADPGGQTCARCDSQLREIFPPLAGASTYPSARFLAHRVIHNRRFITKIAAAEEGQHALWTASGAVRV